MEALSHHAPRADKLPAGPLYSSSIWENPDVVRPARTYIEAEGNFTSERDRQIALHLSETLDRNLIEGRLTPDAHTTANASLCALVPVIGPKGKRLIDGKTIPPAAETLIASRLSAQEVDIAGPEGSWGRLPAAVKDELTRHGTDMKLELAANCTVGCTFCALANKGPVSAKASFESAVAVMDDFMQRQDKTATHPMAGSFDSAYWGTDPFDLKWAATEATSERDYTDLHAAYSAFGTPRSRYFYTSTAVPLGEEMRILHFGHKELYDQNPNYAPLRISRTHANNSRVNHIAAVLRAMRPRNKLVINDVRDHTAIRGAQWATNQQVSLWDITGPNCRDGAIIGVNGVDAVIMQGASAERPSGELRQPIEIPYTGGRRYVIPQHQVKPMLNGRIQLSNIYPDTAITTITIADGVEAVRHEVMAHDPHRALLRIAGALIHFGKLDGILPESVTQTAFNQVFGSDVTTIKEYTAARGGNRSMQGVIGLLIKKGYIKD